jgi:hypothetical protein
MIAQLDYTTLWFRTLCGGRQLDPGEVELILADCGNGNLCADHITADDIADTIGNMVMFQLERGGAYYVGTTFTETFTDLDLCGGQIIFVPDEGMHVSVHNVHDMWLIATG